MSQKTLPFTTVAVRFGSEGKVYDFICPKVIADTLSPDATCIADTYRGPVYVNVVAVHPSPQMQGGINYRWLLQESGHGIKLDEAWKNFLFSIKRTVNKGYAYDCNNELPYGITMPEPPIQEHGDKDA